MNRVLKFIGVGVTAAIVDYVVYELCIAFIFGGNNQFIPIAQLISLFFATFTAFILHSKITWKGRDPGKYGIIKFFIWNFVVLLLIRSFLSWLFGLMNWLFEFILLISNNLNLALTFDFVQSTGIFVMMNIVTMIINYFFYDKFIFGTQKSEPAADKSVKRSANQRKTSKSKEN